MRFLLIKKATITNYFSFSWESKLKIILEESVRIAKKIRTKGEVVEVSELVGKELIAERKAKVPSSIQLTPAPKLSVENVKQNAPEVHKAIVDSAYEEGFKAGIEETSAELKKGMSVHLIEKEFPEVYRAIFQLGVEEGKKHKGK